LYHFPHKAVTAFGIPEVCLLLILPFQKTTQLNNHNYEEQPHDCKNRYWQVCADAPADIVYSIQSAGADPAGNG
jgi:hypothetical protein